MAGRWMLCFVALGCALIAASMYWTSSQVYAVNSPAAPTIAAMGITAALAQQAQGVVLVDLRVPSAKLVPVPHAWHSAPVRPGAAVIPIGSDRQVAAFCQATNAEVLGYVPAFTLNRDTVVSGTSAEISTGRLKQLLRQKAVRLIDLREPEEFAASRLAGSELSSIYNIEQVITDRRQSVALFCETGHRTACAVHRLQAKGFHHVFSVRGGWLLWKAEGRQLVGTAERRQ